MPADSASSIDRFIDALWLEDGLSPNTLAAYRRDLALYARWLGDEAGLVQLTERFGVRRSDRRFWPTSDALHAEWRRTAPREAAILDYSRLDNR